MSTSPSKVNDCEETASETKVKEKAREKSRVPGKVWFEVSSDWLREARLDSDWSTWNAT